MTKISLLPNDSAPVAADILAGVENSNDTTSNFKLSDILTFIKNNLGNSISYADLLSTIFSGQVTSYTNTGSASGTFYYVNIGGIKLLWGISATLGAPTASFGTGASYVINFPSSFFTTVWTGFVTVESVSNTASQFAVLTGSPSATSASFYTLQAGTDASATLQVGFWCIGT